MKHYSNILVDFFQKSIFFLLGNENEKNDLKRKWTIYVEIQNRENSNVTLIQPLECFLLLYENHELVYVVVLPPNVVLALKASVWRALSSILVTFLMETDHISGKNEALRWSLFVGKQKHNIQKPTFFVFLLFLHSYVLTGTEKGMRQTFGTTCHGAVSDEYD